MLGFHKVVTPGVQGVLADHKQAHLEEKSLLSGAVFWAGRTGHTMAKAGATHTHEAQGEAIESNCL